MISRHTDECLLACLVSNGTSYAAKDRVVLSVFDRDLGLCCLLYLLFLLMKGVFEFTHLLHDLLVEVLLGFKLLLKELEPPFDELPLTA